MVYSLYAFMFSSGGSQGGLLDVVPGLIFWTVVTFLILFFLLAKFAWKPILGSLNEREASIKDSLRKAEKAKEEAEQIIAANRANLAKAEEEAQKIIAQGREYSEKLKEQMLAESKAQAKKMIDEASANIERKNQEAFNNLKEQVASIAVEAAGKIIRENLDADKQKVVVRKYLEDLSKN